MDISVIKSENVTTTGGITIGQPDAPLTSIEFINAACPYCRKWFLKSEETMTEAVKAGQLKRIIKPFDKDKEDLQLGNLAHTYLPFDQPEIVLQTLSFLFTHQKTWRNDLTPDEFKKYIDQNLKLTPQDNAENLTAIIAEANRANIKFVPTIILGDHIFDESIDMIDLSQLLK